MVLCDYIQSDKTNVRTLPLQLPLYGKQTLRLVLNCNDLNEIMHHFISFYATIHVIASVIFIHTLLRVMN